MCTVRHCFTSRRALLGGGRDTNEPMRGTAALQAQRMAISAGRWAEALVGLPLCTARHCCIAIPVNGQYWAEKLLACNCARRGTAALQAQRPASSAGCWAWELVGPPMCNTRQCCFASPATAKLCWVVGRGTSGPAIVHNSSQLHCKPSEW